jgi:hypothetical protein
MQAAARLSSLRVERSTSTKQIAHVLAHRAASLLQFGRAGVKRLSTGNSAIAAANSARSRHCGSSQAPGSQAAKHRHHRRRPKRGRTRFERADPRQDGDILMIHHWRNSMRCVFVLFSGLKFLQISQCLGTEHGTNTLKKLSFTQRLTARRGN